MNLAVLTVRTASHRLPGKALLPIGRNMILGMVMERLSYCRSIDLIAMATTNGLEDIPLLKLASRWGIALDLGISGDVVSQTVRLADQLKADYIIRVTADCPFLSWELVDRAFDFVAKNSCDTARLWGVPEQMIPCYGAAEFPISREALRKIDLATQGKSREHLCDDVERHRLEYNVKYAVPHSLYNQTFYRPYRLELDTTEDYQLLRTIYSAIGNAPLHQVIRFLDSHSDLAQINSHIAEKTGPASYSASEKAGWKAQQTMNSVYWEADWSWLASGSPADLPQGAKAVYCSKGTCYIGYSASAGDGKYHLYTKEGDILGRARLQCDCGAGREWYQDQGKR